MESFAFMFSLKISVYHLFFLKIKLLVKTVHSYGHVSFTISIIEGNPTVEYALSKFFLKKLVNSLKQTCDKQYIDGN